jgi:hypothetical protein
VKPETLQKLGEVLMLVGTILRSHAVQRIEAQQKAAKQDGELSFSGGMGGEVSLMLH